MTKPEPSENKDIQFGGRSRFVLLVIFGVPMCFGFMSDSFSGACAGVSGVILICTGLIIDTLMDIHQTIGKNK